MRAWMSSKFSQIWSGTTELAALKHLKNRCCPFFSFHSCGYTWEIVRWAFTGPLVLWFLFFFCHGKDILCWAIHCSDKLRWVIFCGDKRRGIHWADKLYIVIHCGDKCWVINFGDKLYVESYIVVTNYEEAPMARENTRSQVWSSPGRLVLVKPRKPSQNDRKIDMDINYQKTKQKQRQTMSPPLLLQTLCWVIHCVGKLCTEILNHSMWWLKYISSHPLWCHSLCIVINCVDQPHSKLAYKDDKSYVEAFILTDRQAETIFFQSWAILENDLKILMFYKKTFLLSRNFEISSVLILAHLILGFYHLSYIEINYMIMILAIFFTSTTLSCRAAG